MFIAIKGTYFCILYVFGFKIAFIQNPLHDADLYYALAIVRLFNLFSGIFNWFDFNMFSHSSLILDLIILYCFIPFLLSINLFKITPSSMKFPLSLPKYILLFLTGFY